MKEITDFSVLRKGDRVRKYNCENDFHKDGTVEKGTTYGFAYVRWDNEKQIDMEVNIYDVVKLKE